MSTLEEQRKILLPVLKRADEVQQQEPKVAYYCRLYAVQQALSFEKRQPDIDGIVKILMTRLEKDKQKLQLTDTDQQHCETFAQLIFNRAEKMDQAGKWDQNTVVAYYSASYFIEICKQFGELPPDLAQMQKFAAWKASDLRKAIREGRDPTPRTSPLQEESAGQSNGGLPGVQSSSLPQTLPRSFQSLDSMDHGSKDASLPTAPMTGMPADSMPPSSMSRPLSPQQPSQPINMPGPKAPGYSQGPSPGGDSGYPPSGQPAANRSLYPSPAAPEPHQPDAAAAFPGTSISGAGEQQWSSSSGLEQASYVFRHGDSVHHRAPGANSTHPAKIVGSFTQPDGQQLYSVAVAGSGQPVPATAHELAQNFEPGERVLFRPLDHRPPTEASVNQTDLSQWRPVYHITCDHGEVCNTGDECLTRLVEEPRDPLMPPSSLPSKISTSPSDEAEGVSDPYSPAPSTPKSSARTPPAFSFPATTGPTADASQPSAPQGPPMPPSSGYPSMQGQQPQGYCQTNLWQQPDPSAFYGGSAQQPPPPPPPSAPAAAVRPPPPPPPPLQQAPGPASYDPIPGFQPSLAEVMEAHKLSKYAASALSFEDVPTAIKHLTNALKLLTQPNQLKTPHSMRS